jgi:tripeptidyl-peptidase-1
MRFIALAALLACACALFSPASADSPVFRVKERSSIARNAAATSKLRSLRQEPQQPWVGIGEVDDDVLMELHVFMRHPNIAKMEDALLAVSDPVSPSYGREYTRDELDVLSAPPAAASAAVSAWFARSGVASAQVESSRSGDKHRLLVPVAVAERLLDADFTAFCHSQTGRAAIRAAAYSLPEDVFAHIDFVGPTVHFPPVSARAAAAAAAVANSAGSAHTLSACHTALRARPRARSSAELASVAATLHRARTRAAASVSVERSRTPAPASAYALRRSAGVLGDEPWELPTVSVAMLTEGYNSKGYTATTNVTLAAAGFMEQFISPADTAQFLAKYAPEDAAGRGVRVRGYNNASLPAPEGSLDVQWLLAMAPGVREIEYWYVPDSAPGRPENEPFLDLLFALADEPAPPSVLSISYGDSEASVPEEYAARVDAEFLRGGLRRVSFVVASGDGGVGGPRPEQCKQFVPVYPASSPYVTAVGGTTGFDPEVAASLSGGGFSRRAGRADWQHAAVEGFLSASEAAEQLPDRTLFNEKGRGYPDISAQALRFPVIVNGARRVLDGTSAAAPVVAALVALLNDVRARAGKPTLGFLNPLFYAAPARAFNDVKMGSNPGCDTDGFVATAGWDPVSGLGTPNFALLAEYVKTLP